MMDILKNLWLRPWYAGRQRGATAFSMVAVLGVLGLSTAYFADQSQKTDQLAQEVGRNRSDNEARRINISSFALAKSLLSYRLVGSGTQQHAQAALYASDYFNMDGWDLQRNSSFASQTSHWEWADQTLTIRTPLDQSLPDQAVHELVSSGQSLNQMAAAYRAETKMRFGRVYFDNPDEPYLATAIDAIAETTFQDGRRQNVQATDRARINLQPPAANASRLVIRSPNGHLLAATGGPGSSASNPMPPGEVQFSLYGSGLVSLGEIYWGFGDIDGPDDCMGCQRYVFDDRNYKSFWDGRQRNILATEQLIGRISEQYNPNPGAEVEKDSDGNVVADGATCSVRVNRGAENAGPIWKWNSPNEVARQVTAFGTVCSADQTADCFTTKISFWIAAPPRPATTWQAVKAICSKPHEKPECVLGHDADFRPTFSKGRQSNGRYALTFSPQHWDHWTNKMGIKELKLCIDGNALLAPVDRYCGTGPRSSRRGHVRKFDRCYARNFRYNWEQLGIHYIDPVECEPKFLFNRTACGCFSEDTKILMGDQSLKAIKDIQQGDEVWNPITKRATAIKKMIVGPEDKPMVHIQTETGLLKVTGNHPFPTPDGIKAAFELRAGEILFDDQRNKRQIQSIEFVHYDKPPTVWNLELVGRGQDEDHFLIADGIVTGDLLIQQRLENRSRHLVRHEEP